jgi:pyrroline-5-carboxylate reductase
MQNPSSEPRIAILGAGNIGRAMARGFVDHGGLPASQITLTRRHPDTLAAFADEGFTTTSDNLAATRDADLVILAVEPRQTEDLARSLLPALPGPTALISVASGVAIQHLDIWLDHKVPVVRAMPNTAAALGRSMTCLTAGPPESRAMKTGPLTEAESLFARLGETLIIDEELMTQATALAACGIAFFLRAIRAASQGGIEIGFHPTEALKLAAQTALGAASLVSTGQSHPESAIDSVTTPRGCTIAGLNEMEHQGFSSAIIRGIITSANRAERA